MIYIADRHPSDIAANYPNCGLSEETPVIDADDQQGAIALCENSADMLDRQGWCRGYGRGEEGTQCLLSALERTSRGNAHRTELLAAACAALNSVLREHLPPGSNFIGWNDRVCENKHQAADALRAAAKHLAEEVNL